MGPHAGPARQRARRLNGSHMALRMLLAVVVAQEPCSRCWFEFVRHVDESLAVRHTAFQAAVKGLYSQPLVATPQGRLASHMGAAPCLGLRHIQRHARDDWLRPDCPTLCCPKIWCFGQDRCTNMRAGSRSLGGAVVQHRHRG